MSFEYYLSESKNEEIDLDEFIKKIKEKGLYGFNVFSKITESELRKIIADDKYFESRMQKEGLPTNIPLSEMVIRPDKNKKQKAEDPKSSKLSLAVRLGLKKEVAPESQEDQSGDQENSNKTKLNVFAKGREDEQDQTDTTPQSFADRIRAEYERRKQEREELADKEKELRDQRAKEAEESNKDKPAVTFGNKSLIDQQAKDQETSDKKNDDLDKQLTDAMFKRTRANTKVDNDGYKKVTNAGSVNDRSAEERLRAAMDKRFPKSDPEKESKQKLGNSNQLVSASRRSNNEYSKRTLLAIADRMDFDVYCKFRKANGEIRTGTFRIGKTVSQITQKQDTIIVTDLDLLAQTKEQKESWRTIPLQRILEIKPI